MNKIVPALAFAALCFTTVSACATTEKPKAQARAAPAGAATAPKKTAVASAPGGSVRAGLEAPSSPIYFAFDSDQLTIDSQHTLQAMAGYLKENPKAVLTIEGHCDESGSGEYNLALGDRRARAARAYLKALGVEDTRLKSISYGEEKPAVAGSDDAANEKNRRGQFDLKPS